LFSDAVFLRDGFDFGDQAGHFAHKTQSGVLDLFAGDNTFTIQASAFVLGAHVATPARRPYKYYNKHE
jgi:hypothetical protein